MAKGTSTGKWVEYGILAVVLYWAWKHQDTIKGWIDNFSNSLNSQLGSGNGGTADAQPDTGTPDTSNQSGSTDTSTSDAGNGGQTVPDTTGNGGTSGDQTVPDSSNGVQPQPQPQPQPQVVPAPVQQQVAPSQVQAPAIQPQFNCPQVIGPGCPDCCNVGGNCVCKGNSNCPCNGCPATVGTCAGDTPVTTGQVVAPVVQRHLNPRQRGIIQHHAVNNQPTSLGPQTGTFTFPRQQQQKKTTVSNAPKGNHGNTNVSNNIHRANVPQAQTPRQAPRTTTSTKTVVHPTTTNRPVRTPQPRLLPNCPNNIQILPCGNFCIAGGARRKVVCIQGGVRTLVAA